MEREKIEAKKEIKEGKHGIGYVSSSFESRFYDKEFDSVKTPPSFQKLPRNMTDAQIESELKPGFCTLGDVLAVIQSDNAEFKDGNWNLFYFEACVVVVGWRGSYWDVLAFDRDDRAWAAGRRVFSPATGNSATVSSVPSDSEALGSLTADKTKDIDWKTKYQNASALLAAVVWHLNNMDKDGNPTTKVCIPNAVYEVVGKKMARLPDDKRIEEHEALEIARKK